MAHDLSYHKYDTIDYMQIDPCLGMNDDLKELVESAHARGMKVILDGVFNHCGSQFFAFRDVMEKGKDSPYFNWFYRIELTGVISFIFPIYVKNPSFA